MLSIFSPTTTDAEACQYYRIDTPMKFLEQAGCNTYVQKTRHLTDEKKFMNIVFGADIVWTYNARDTAFWLSLVNAASKMSPIPSEDGMRFPPIFVWDSDDNLDFVHPLNQTYIWSGTRGIDYKQLSPGDSIVLADGTPIWKDMETKDGEGNVFNIARNLDLARGRREMIRTYAGATCSSENLASYYRSLGQKNVYVYHNTIVPEDYAYNVTPVRTDPENVRIFWQGGQSHISDWTPLKEAVRKVAAKYPNTKWIFFGESYQMVAGAIPEHQQERHKWMSYDAYRLRRTLFNVDINLCPLQDTIFNRGKSAIKWYESTVSSNTEATLAQAVGPYLEIEDGKTGLLFKDADEFYTKLCLLIENAELRLRLGANAREWVNNNRLPQHTVPGLLDFFNELKEQQRHALSPKIVAATPSLLKEALAARK